MDIPTKTRNSTCVNCGATPLVYYLDPEVCRPDGDQHYRCDACGWTLDGACSLQQSPAGEED